MTDLAALAPFRRRAEALRTAAGALEILDVPDVTELLRVARWLLDKPEPSEPDEWPQRAEHQDHGEPTDTGAPTRLGDIVPGLARALNAQQARTARR